MTPDMIRARQLLNEGCAAFAKGDIDGAENCFRESKRLAPDTQTKNTASLYLGCVFNFRFIPNMCPEEKAANDNWLSFAAAEFNEVLRNEPTDRDRGYAERNLKSIEVLAVPTNF